jgi:nitrite reductase (NADH) large subunit
MNVLKKREKLVVVGGGLSGVACVEEILKSDPDRYEITVLCGEKHVNYNRVLLSQVLMGEKGVEDLYLQDPKWYGEQGIRLFTGCKAEEINRSRRTVIGTGGVEVPYNKLILATGSLPVIPRIPGVGLKGVVYFRDIKDCERIKNLLGKDGEARKVVVIGGGILGLEVAFSLKSLGAEVTVVHLMNRLMERQLDETAAGFLLDDIEALGIKVLLGAETSAISADEGGGRVEAVEFAGGGSLDTDIVVMSIGIRPNAALASSSGIYCGKGIVVSDTMQTYDPAVFAIGECVEHRGATFGLAASVFDQARVLANHLAGDSRLIFINKPASTRLKVPGVNLYSAGSIEEVPGRETIEYLDRGAKLYKKLFLKNNSIKGVILYGDTIGGPELFAQLVEGVDITNMRGRLLLGPGPGELMPIDEMPADAIVCGCNGVTKGMIVEAVEKKGLFTREDVKRETNASSSCGGCGSLVDRILENILGTSFEAQQTGASICACTKYSRDDIIKNIREQALKSVQEVMDTLGWESVGCDICRPAINYYVSMVWPGTYRDDSSSRLINERAHANIQKDGLFSVVPRVYGGVITPVELKRIAEVAEKYDVPLVKVTGGQRLALFGISKEDLPKVWRDIDMVSGYAYGKSLRTVKTCVGDRFCRYGTQDSLGLGIALEQRLEGLWTPAKLKLGVDGCPRNCAESAVKDVGITGVAGGWEIYVGGCGGIELKGGELLATVKTASEATEIVSAFIQLYREEAQYGERTFKWIKRAGFKKILKAVVEDTGSRDALVERLEEALRGKTDPWKRVKVPA